MTIQDILNRRGAIKHIEQTAYISKGTLYNIRSGRTVPKLDVFIAICRAVGEEPSEVLKEMEEEI